MPGDDSWTWRRNKGHGKGKGSMEVDEEGTSAGIPRTHKDLFIPPNDLPEHEEDAPVDKRAKFQPESFCINSADTTLNLLQVADGKTLMGLSEGGFQYLHACARAAAGAKAGRYLYEVTILENLNPYEPQTLQGRPSAPLPRQLVRVGLSTSGSSLFLADGDDFVCFDSEGFFNHGASRKRVSHRFGADQTVGLLLNLNKEGPNSNTVSLFRDGKRVCEPQPLPENLQGKTLFPTISFRNVTVHVNLGPVARVPLPFTCRMLADAASKDVVLVTANAEEKGEVIFPVGLPDQGFFDWVDFFVKNNPEYAELSDRAIYAWAEKSGLKSSARFGIAGSNDKPDTKFGFPLLDDFSVRKVLSACTPTMQRQFVIPELKSNLLAADRKAALARYPAADFKRKAVVLLGESPADYKVHVQELMLADRKRKAEEAKKRAAEEAARKKARKVLPPKAMSKAEAKKEMEVAAKKEEAAPMEVDAGKDGAEEKKEGEAKEGDNREEEKKQEENKEEAKEDKKEEAKPEEKKEEANEGAEVAKEEPKQEEPKEAEKPAEEQAEKDPEPMVDVPIELTEEEKKMNYRKTDIADLADRVFSKVFSDFSLPTKAEGFDEVEFVWSKQAACDKLLAEYIKETKMTTKVDDLQPGSEFLTAWTAYKKTLQDWKKLQADKKVPTAPAGLLRPTKTSVDSGEEAEAAEGEDEATSITEKVGKVNIAEVEDVTDVTDGQPLFLLWNDEDWTVLNTAFEFHLLLQAFRKDLNDPERPSFREAHVSFYYNKYFKKGFSFKNFGAESLAEFVDAFKKFLKVEDGTGFLQLTMPGEADVAEYAKITEEFRRERQRRIDAGDETAKLKFTVVASPAPALVNRGGQPHWQATGPVAHGGPYGGQKRIYGGQPRTYGGGTRQYGKGL